MRNITRCLVTIAAFFWSGLAFGQEFACKPGQPVPEAANSDLFQIQFLAIPGTPTVQDILRREGFVAGVKVILNGVGKGSIPRTEQDGNGTVLIEGVNPKTLSSRLPYLMGDDICQQGRLEVIPHGTGVLVVVPNTRQTKGQSTLLVPRAVAAQASRICVEAPYLIYSKVESGNLVTGKLNCSDTGAATLARQGVSSALFLLARAQ